LCPIDFFTSKEDAIESLKSATAADDEAALMREMTPESSIEPVKRGSTRIRETPLLTSQLSLRPSAARLSPMGALTTHQDLSTNTLAAPRRKPQRRTASCDGPENPFQRNCITIGLDQIGRCTFRRSRTGIGG
jgi:hypothetical protein